MPFRPGGDLKKAANMFFFGLRFLSWGVKGDVIFLSVDGFVHVSVVGRFRSLPF